MRIMTVETIRDKMKDRNIRAVAERSGVPATKIYRLMTGAGIPSYSTVLGLSMYLDGEATNGSK